MRHLFAGLLVLTLGAGLAACQTRSAAPPPVYVVFFEGKSVELTPDARKIVDTAAGDAKGATMVQITGPSTKLTPRYDPGLAEPRIKLVEKELRDRGIPAEKLVHTSLTTEDVMVNTSGAQRVEIRIIK